MGRFLLIAGFIFSSWGLWAQSFEVSGLTESYKGSIGELIHAPLKFKNTSDKAVILIFRRIETQIGSSQKNYYCIDKNCFDQRSETYSVKIEPGETLENFSIGLEAGLTEGFSTVKYSVFNKSNPSEVSQFELNFIVEGRREKSNIYSSQFITLHDVYPNPVTSSARLDYTLHTEQLKAKIIVHNILGSPLSEYELPFHQNTLKLDADQLTTGIYFYTLYINNEGVVTRKLMVKNKLLSLADFGKYSVLDLPVLMLYLRAYAESNTCRCTCFSAFYCLFVQQIQEN